MIFPLFCVVELLMSKFAQQYHSVNTIEIVQKKKLKVKYLCVDLSLDGYWLKSSIPDTLCTVMSFPPLSH